MKFLKPVLALLVTTSFLLITTPASAHDGVISTTPANQSTVAADLLTVSVTFAEDILDVNQGQGLAIQIVSPTGERASASCIEVTGATMSVETDLDEPGTYQVSWQSVSADGHPSTGAFSFILKNEDGYQATDQPNCEPLATESAAPIVISTQQSDEPEGDHDSSTGSDSQTPFFLGLLVVAATLVGGIFYNRKRKTKTKGGSDAS